MGKRRVMRLTSFRRAGRLVPRRPRGLRAGSVILRMGEAMDWHSTNTREELLITLAGKVEVEVCSARRRRRFVLTAGRCVFLPAKTLHRLVNRSRGAARYLYVTAPSG